MRWWFALVLVAVTAIPSQATGFAVHAPPGESPSATVFHAMRWTSGTQDLVSHDQVGLGGGIEFSVDPDFCSNLARGFPGKSDCTQLLATIYEAMAAWEAVDDRIRFVDVSDRILAENDAGSFFATHGSELDIFAAFATRGELAQGMEAATGSSLAADADVILTNGTHATAKPMQRQDLQVFVDDGCRFADDVACWDYAKLRRIVTHELGHAVGLQHPFEDDRRLRLAPGYDCARPAASTRRDSSLPDSIMNYDGTGGESLVITADDMAAVRVLYPTCSTSAASQATVEGSHSAGTTPAYRVQGTAVHGSSAWVMWIFGGGAIALAVTGFIIWLVVREGRPAGTGPEAPPPWQPNLPAPPAGYRYYLVMPGRQPVPYYPAAFGRPTPAPRPPMPTPAAPVVAQAAPLALAAPRPVVAARPPPAPVAIPVASPRPPLPVAAAPKPRPVAKKTAAPARTAASKPVKAKPKGTAKPKKAPAKRTKAQV